MKMVTGNALKDQVLEMPHGTAAARLRKSILFAYVVECGDDVCFKCGQQISHIDDLSIEHKTPWLYAENGKELFFSLENIAFSHTKCNVAKSQPSRRIVSPDGHSYCVRCKAHKLISAFPKDNYRPRFTGVASRCQDCTNREKRERRAVRKQIRASSSAAE
jgi:hypothetical protein